MSTEKTEPTLTTESTEEERSAAHAATRRKLLKAGIAGAPVIITLRSGTAWAVSSCVDRISQPGEGEANARIGAAVTEIQTQIPGSTPESIQGVIDGSVVIWDPPQTEKDIYYLAAYSPSCYTSFCEGATSNGCVIT